MRSIKIALLVSAFALPAPMCAATVFDLSPTTGTTSRAGGSGPAQGIFVTTSQTITSMAFNIFSPNAGNVRYFITDSTRANVLFSTTFANAAGNSLNWVTSNPFSFNLVAGSTYYFGAISDSALRVGFISPQAAYTSNGLTALTNGNANFSGYANPVAQSGLALAQIGLRLEGVTAAVPEPATWAMMIGGFGIAGIALRRRRRMTVSYG